MTIQQQTFVLNVETLIDMKFEVDCKSKIKSFSIITKKMEMIIRYWGGLNFDIVRAYNTPNPNAT